MMMTMSPLEKEISFSVSAAQSNKASHSQGKSGGGSEGMGGGWEVWDISRPTGKLLRLGSPRMPPPTWPRGRARAAPLSGGPALARGLPISRHPRGKMIQEHHHGDP